MFGFLILGGETPIVVDTGFSHPEIMGNLGMKGFYHGDQGMDKQLAKHGLQKSDVGFILHTHLHIDHAGKDSEFPMDTVVVINRRELEFSVSGLMGEQYPADYIKHLVDRLHTRGALRLLDLELAGPEEIIPGVRCEVAGGSHRGLDERARRHRRGHRVHLRGRDLRRRQPAQQPVPPGHVHGPGADRKPRDAQAPGKGGDSQGGQLRAVRAAGARPARA